MVFKKDDAIPHTYIDELDCMSTILALFLFTCTDS